MPKWVIVVLVVVGVLFVISLAAGSRQDRRSGSGFGDSLKGLSNTDPLELSDVRLGPGCAGSGGRLTVVGACEVHVGAAGRFDLAVREARLQFIPGGQPASGTATLVPAEGPTQTASFAEDPKVNLDFPRKGGTIRIQCPSGCVLAFG
jgi:hypothetical protein